MVPCKLRSFRDIDADRIVVPQVLETGELILDVYERIRVKYRHTVRGVYSGDQWATLLLSEKKISRSCPSKFFWSYWGKKVVILNKEIITDWTGEKSIMSWEVHVLNIRQKKRVMKKLERVDEASKGIRPLPMARVRKKMKKYFIPSDMIRYEGKECFCSHCESHFSTEEKLSHNEKLHCPSCKKEFILKNNRRMPSDKCIVQWVLVPQKKGSDLVFRYLRIIKEIKQSSVSYEISELLRDILTPEKTIDLMWDNCVGSTRLEQHRFVPFRNKWGMFNPSVWSLPVNGCHVLGPVNLKGTWLEKSSYDLFVQTDRNKISHDPWRDIHYVNEYRARPVCAKFVMTGMWDLYKDLIIQTWRTNPVRERAAVKDTSIHEVLGLSKPRYRLFLRTDRSKAVYDVISNDHYISETDPEMIGKISRLSYGREQFYDKFRNSQTWVKMLDYVLEKNCDLRSYVDYYGWLADCGHVLGPRALYPENFREAHDRLKEEYEKKKAAILEKLYVKYDRQQKRAAKKSPAFDLGKGVVIRSPRGTAEIRAEGAALHHCVATHIPAIVRGEEELFFVRRMEDLKTPYFTFSLIDGKIDTIKGDYNCDPPEQVRKAVEAFAAHIAQFRQGEQTCLKVLTA